MMSNDFNLFILWANGRHKENDILADIRQQFDILQIFEITWSTNEFNRNLSRFYGKKLPNAMRKKKLCGTSSFLVICVNDTAPKFHEGKNLNMVMAKAKYRQLLEGNYIHASDNQEEAEENLLFLTGLHPDELRPGNQTVTLFQDLAGAPTWLDEEQFKEFINKLPQLKLTLSATEKMIETPDIKQTCRLLNARKKFLSYGKNRYLIPIRGKEICFCLKQSS